MSIAKLTTERTALINLWNANKDTLPAPTVTAEELNTALSVEWTTIGTLNVPVTNCNGGLSNAHTHAYSFHIHARVSNGSNPMTRVRVCVQGSRRHVIKRMAYPSKKGPLTAERLVQDLRGHAGEGDGARAVVREEEELCCGRERPCGCEGWRKYFSGSAAFFSGLRPWIAPMALPVALGVAYVTVENWFV